MSLLNRWKIKSSESKALLDRRPLPMGATEFEEWSDRIIQGSLLIADATSLKFALANMIMHLGPTESHKEDAFFIHQLRKSAANQVAHAKIEEYKAAYAAKIKEKQDDAPKLAVVEDKSDTIA
jgi:hypothetical protein